MNSLEDLHSEEDCLCCGIVDKIGGGDLLNKLCECAKHDLRYESIWIFTVYCYKLLNVILFYDLCLLTLGPILEKLILT